jgi:uncharacterized protein YdcH (DUF465 family)
MDEKWLALLGVPVLGWIIKKVLDCMNKTDVKELIVLHMNPIKENHKSIEEKIDTLDERLTRVEDKIDRLSDTIIQALKRR